VARWTWRIYLLTFSVDDGAYEDKEMRLKLMEERSRFDQDQTATVEDATFNLCEH